jgi:hypothetical protein
MCNTASVLQAYTGGVGGKVFKTTALVRLQRWQSALEAVLKTKEEKKEDKTKKIAAQAAKSEAQQEMELKYKMVAPRKIPETGATDSFTPSSSSSSSSSSIGPGAHEHDPVTIELDHTSGSTKDKDTAPSNKN